MHAPSTALVDPLAHVGRTSASLSVSPITHGCELRHCEIKLIVFQWIVIVRDKGHYGYALLGYKCLWFRTLTADGHAQLSPTLASFKLQIIQIRLAQWAVKFANALLEFASGTTKIRFWKLNRIGKWYLEMIFPGSTFFFFFFFWIGLGLLFWFFFVWKDFLDDYSKGMFSV